MKLADVMLWPAADALKPVSGLLYFLPDTTVLL